MTPIVTVEDILEEAKLWKFRYFFLFVDTIFLILSILLMYTIITVRNIWYYFDPFLGVYYDFYNITAYTTGLPLIILAASGYYVAFKNKRAPLVWFGLFILMMMAIELIFLIHILGSTENSDQKTSKLLNDAIHGYQNNTYYRRKIDKVHLSLQCCGANDLSDWTHSMYPLSCCPMNPECNFGNLFTKACLPELLSLGSNGVAVINYIIVMILCIEFLILLLCSGIYGTFET